MTGLIFVLALFAQDAAAATAPTPAPAAGPITIGRDPADVAAAEQRAAEAAAAAAAPPPAAAPEQPRFRAAPPPPPPQSTRDFLASCDNQPDECNERVVRYVTYRASLGGKYGCASEPDGRIVKTMMGWIRKHKGLEEQAANETLRQAAEDAWPCLRPRKDMREQ